MSNLEPEEVNVIDVLASIYGTFRTHLTAAILLTTLCTAGFILVYSLTEERYKSAMVIGTTLLTHQEAILIGKELESYTVFDKNTAKKIRSITCEVIPDEYMAEKEQSLALDKLAQRPQRSVLLNVTAILRDTADFPVVEKAILSILSNSVIVTRRREEQSKYYSQLIQSIDQELTGLSELTQKLDSKFLGHPSEVFLAIVALKKEKTMLQLELDNIREMHLVKSFNTTITAGKRPVSTYAIVGLVVGLFIFIGYLIVRATVIHYRKRPAMQ
jgi:hypothetical protein